MTTAKVEWDIIGEEVASCNCDWGCPCQFNALPTKGFCEALVGLRIEHGHFGSTSLDGVIYAQLVHFDGPVHAGNGHRLLVIDEKSSPEQQEAIKALTSGAHGHPVFEIFSAMMPNQMEPVVAPISFEVDRERRLARISIPGIAETEIQPIKNPVTGDEHRARIDLPNGFEFKLAEVGNSLRWNGTAGGKLSMAHENTYAQLARVEWASDGTTK